MRMKALSGAVAAWLALCGAATAQVSDDVVKIGVLTDMSAQQTDSSGLGSVLAAQLASEDFKGRVLGKPIVIVSADQQAKPDVSSNIARQWLDREQVDVVSDVTLSSIAFLVQTLTRERNKIFLGSTSGSSDLTGPACSPNAVHWTYDTYSLANGVAAPLVAKGADSWFFVTADYAFGHALERDTSEAVKRAGGKIVASVRYPTGMSDFSSQLLTGQSSKAKVIALATPVGDTAVAAKQAGEFGIIAGGQQLVGLSADVIDLKAIGLDALQGMMLTVGFYWDLNDETRAFAKRFFDRKGQMPTQYQAGIYSSIRHYLTAVQDTGTDDPQKVLKKMRETPVNDFFAKNGIVREDGRMIHDMYLMQVKTPAESKGSWDVLKLLATIPGNRAFRPIDAGGCPLVTKQ